MAYGKGSRKGGMMPSGKAGRISPMTVANKQVSGQAPDAHARRDVQALDRCMGSKNENSGGKR